MDKYPGETAFSNRCTVSVNYLYISKSLDWQLECISLAPSLLQSW